MPFPKRLVATVSAFLTVGMMPMPHQSLLDRKRQVCAIRRRAVAPRSA